MNRRNVWALLRSGKLVAVELTKDEAWKTAESLLFPVTCPRLPSRHELMSHGFAVVAAYLEASPNPSQHYRVSRAA